MRLTVKELENFQNKKRIKTLDLSNMDLTVIPQSVFECTNLRKLYIQHNNLHRIPKKIEVLKNLVLLDASNNSIANLHTGITKLGKLRTLNLGKNLITNLPKQFSDLINVQILIINGNKIKSIGIISQLKKVRKLHIGNNPIDEIPEQLKSLTCLKYLWLNDLPDKVKLDPFVRHFANIAKVYVGPRKDSNVETMEDIGSHQITDIKTMQEEDKRTEVFISYSQKDDIWLDRLKIHLEGSLLDGLKLKIWHDKNLKIGENWESKIEQHLKSSRFSILLISANFFASGFIIRNELQPLILKANNEGARIFPLIVDYSRYKRVPWLKKIQAFPDPDTPLSSMTDSKVEETLDLFVNEIEEWVGKLND